MDEAKKTGGASAVIAVLIVVALAIAALLISPSLLGDSDGAGSSAAGNLSGGVTATGEVTRVEVSVKGMSFEPSIIEVPAGDTLELTLTNTGDQRHDLYFVNGVQTDPLAPGASQTITVGTITGDLEGWCTLPGHRQMGMTLDIVATGAPDSSERDENPGHSGNAGHSGNGGQAIDVPTAAQLIEEAEAATPHPAELPPLKPSDGQPQRHEFTFTVTEDEQALAEGTVRPVWTYNGTSPGPTLHGRIGDTFHITLVNNGTMGHSIDFHAGELAPDEPMRTIEPGESLEYEFVAGRAGIWMYHCSTMPMSLHIATGMFGAVVIEPDDLPEVDRSYVLVQSEIYLTEDPSSLVPDLMAFNGRPFQYDVHPLPAKVGERIRFWVLDVGPNLELAFHVVGGQFDTVWNEGTYTVYHGESTDGITKGTTGAQVLPLLAAEGGFVEMVPVEAGRYPFVNHSMSLAEKGAHGFLDVTE